MRVALLCPGRGSYTKSELGSLIGAATGPFRSLLSEADAWRRSVGRTPVSELDGAERFGALHLRGENAAALIYVGTAFDARRVDPAFDVVAVAGNSMGWYSALHVAGVFDFVTGLRLADTMGSLQAEQGLIGGQIIYPLVDGSTWNLDSRRRRALETLTADLRRRGHTVALSIRLGGFAVLAGDAEALRLLAEGLPKVTMGERDYPFQLLGHSAFHTRLMEPTRDLGWARLKDLPWRAPSIPLVDGRGHQFRPRSTSPDDLRRYTLDHQVVDTFDFTAAVRVILREYAPDALVLLGPGDALGAAVGMIVVEERWRGITDKSGFLAQQSTAAPLVLSMGRPEQRAKVVGPVG